jgi:hypothetical protein
LRADAKAASKDAAFFMALRCCPMQPSFLRTRRASLAALHLLASAFVASLAAVVVFALWYPPPFAAVAGGFGLFIILISVDVVLGPMLTAIVAAPGKPVRSLRRDILVIAVVQLAGLTYGMHAIAESRPVALSFEVDRMRVVTAADIEPETLDEAQPGFRTLPWTGPRLLAAVRPTQPDEVLRSIELGLGGFDISMFPRHWRDYASQSEAAWRVSRPVSELLAKYPQAGADVERLAKAAGQPAQALRFMPLLSRHASWVTLIAAPDARVLGHLPYEGFF